MQKEVHESCTTLIRMQQLIAYQILRNSVENDNIIWERAKRSKIRADPLGSNTHVLVQIDPPLLNKGRIVLAKGLLLRQVGHIV